MRYIRDYFCCSKKLLDNFNEIDEIFEIIESIEWIDDFFIFDNDKKYEHQKGYNKAFEIEFVKKDWKKQPLLHEELKLKGDFKKNDIFVEVQFKNSASIYRDYYKFHYGLLNDLLSIAVLIVPENAKNFFPTRIESVNNMAEYNFADKTFKILKIPVPILLIGLLPEN